MKFRVKFRVSSGDIPFIYELLQNYSINPGKQIVAWNQVLIMIPGCRPGLWFPTLRPSLCTGMTLKKQKWDG